MYVVNKKEATVNLIMFCAAPMALLIGSVAVVGYSSCPPVEAASLVADAAISFSSDPYGCTKRIRWTVAGWEWEPCESGKCVPSVPACREDLVDEVGSVDSRCLCGDEWPVFGACQAWHRVPDGGAEHIDCWTVGCPVPSLCFVNHLLSFPTVFTPVCLCS